MLKIGSHAVGVDQGEVILFSDFEDGGEMWTGNGPRLIRKHVTFAQAYTAPPVVQTSLSMWDMSNGANARADVTSDAVTETGFAIVFRTWGDTRVARVRVAWTSIGPLRGDDTWVL